MSAKTFVIDAGGQRGIFGAGVFDCCPGDGASFDGCAVVSVGGANAGCGID